MTGTLVSLLPYICPGVSACLACVVVTRSKQGVWYITTFRDEIVFSCVLMWSEGQLLEALGCELASVLFWQLEEDV